MTAIYALEAHTKRGFTLTEIAIVLGIIGIILGAIWAAAGSVYSHNRAQKAANEFIQIVGGYRSLYASHGVDSGNWGDITCVGVNSSFFPSDMLRSGVICATGDGATYPETPWSGSSYAQAWTYQSNEAVIVGFLNIPQDACNDLANAVTSTNDAIWQNINGTTQWLNGINGGGTPYNASTINSLCVAGSVNAVEVMYTVR